MKNEVSAGVIVCYEEVIHEQVTRYYLLLLYRNGYWDFAKGKLENNETTLQAAIRELKEETGLEVSIYKDFEQTISYIYKDKDEQLVAKEVTFYVGCSESKHVTLSSEHLNYKWAPYKEALADLTYSSAQQVLTLAEHALASQKEK